MAPLSSVLSGVAQDVRFGLRQFRRSPVLTVTIVLSLALGIGANTATFSLVNAVMLRDLPVDDPGRLVVLQYAEPERGLPQALDHTHSGRGSQNHGRDVGLSISWPSFTYIQARARSFSGIAGFVPLGMFDHPTAIVHGEPMFVDGDMVTAGFFPAVGVSTVAGRAIVRDDEQPDAPRVAVISDRFWNRAFARSRSALGTSITLNGVPVTIVGVAPASFTGLETGRSPDFWIQMGPQPGLVPWGGRVDGSPQTVFAAPDWWWLEAVGRLKPGVSLEQARLELERLFRESLLASVASPIPPDKLPSVFLAPAATGLNTISQRLSKPLTLVMVVVAVVLLIACANVATLLLARATARRKEMSVRLAMGAPRSRLVRQLLTESLLTAAAGSVAGLLVASWGGRALLVLLTQGREPVPLDVRLDPAVLGFTAAIAVLTTLVFGLAPALRATRVAVAADLKENMATSRGESGAGRLRGGKLLVAVQVALSLPLVFGAGLFLRTLGNLEHQALGFDPDRILLFKIDPTKAGFKDTGLLRAFAEVEDRVRSLPGVRGVSASRLGLITGWVNNGTMSLDDEGANGNPRTCRAFWNQVTPGFFDTMGMPLLLGRRLDTHDGADGPDVAVVNETMARQVAPSGNPIGRRFWYNRTRQGKPVEIVGVVRDAKYASLRAPVPPTAYVPHTQSRTPLAAMVFEVRAVGDPMALVGGIRQVVKEVVPGVPIGDVKTQTRQIEDSLGQETMYVRLFSFFGVVALLLACIGLYGTMAYALGRRTREIGIRMALGAARGRVLRMALVESVVVAVVGVGAGVLLATAGSRYIRSLLFEVDPLDVPTLATGVFVMFAVAMAAGYLPARRASRLDPLRALREE